MLSFQDVMWWISELSKRSSRNQNEKQINCCWRFCLLTDKFTDISNCTKLSIFVQSIDSDAYDIKEEFLGMTEVVGNKEAEASFNTISKTLIKQGIPPISDLMVWAALIQWAGKRQVYSNDSDMQLHIQNIWTAEIIN